MKRFIKALSLAMMGLIAMMATGCGRIEQPDWLKKKLCEHVFEAGDVIRESTCTTKGKQQEYCSECGETRIVSIPTTHKWDKGTEGGNSLTYYTCLDCGAVKTEASGICYHENIFSEEGFIKNGMCQDCGKFVFNDVTYSDVAKGDTLSGWYKVTPEGKYNDMMLFTDGLDCPELGLEGYKISEPYSFMESKDFNLCDLLYLGLVKNLPGSHEHLDEYTYSEPTYQTVSYGNSYYIYVSPKGYKNYYTLSKLDMTVEDYVVYGAIGYTFTNFKFRSFSGGTIEKVNFN